MKNGLNEIINPRNIIYNVRVINFSTRNVMNTLDINECAEFLKVNKNTASELAAKGMLPGAKIGRAWVFLEDELVEYLRSETRNQQRRRQSDFEDSRKYLSPELKDIEIINLPKSSSRRKALPILP
jgi:excisionase family DNA binding protein